MTSDPQQPLERKSAAIDSLVGRLLQEHFTLLQAFLRLRMGPDLRARESCSDLAQSVCADLLAQKDFEFRGIERFRAWICRAAVNKLHERRRHYGAQKRNAAREVATLSEAEVGQLGSRYASMCTPSRHAMGREELARIESAFDRMPDDYREVIVLSRLIGLPHAEIAGIMNRTAEAVRVLLNRALVRLATLLGQ